MILFFRTLPLTLALAALLAFPHFVGGTAEDAGKLVDLVNRFQAVMEGDTEALENLELTALSTTDWGSERFEERWVPLVSDGPGMRQGDVDLAEMLRATELPIDAHLQRRAAQ